MTSPYLYLVVLLYVQDGQTHYASVTVPWSSPIRDETQFRWITDAAADPLGITHGNDNVVVLNVVTLRSPSPFRRLLLRLR